MRPTPDPRLLASSLHPCCFTQFLYFIDRFPSKGSKGFALFNAVFNIFISMLKRFTTKVAVSRRQLVHWVKQIDRKSTRLNSSHVRISYAVFCLKKNSTDVVKEVQA